MDLFNNPAFIKYQFIIKNLSLCIFGEDVSEQIKKFKPTNEIIENLPLLKTRINKIKNKFNQKLTSEETQQICLSIMRSILRAGFELCIEKEKCFTKDITHCLMIFSKYFPAQKEKMKVVFDLTIVPINDKQKITNILDDLGMWLMNIYQTVKRSTT